MAEVEEKRNDLENFKSDVLTQLRELVYQCDLTLKAVRMCSLCSRLEENHYCWNIMCENDLIYISEALWPTLLVY